MADLSRAVGALAEYLEEPGRSPEATRRYALEAARDANAVLEERNDLAIAALIAQIRSTTVDILRGTGMDYQEALVALEESVAHSPQEPTDAPRGPDPSQEPQWWSEADAPSAISRPTNRCFACLGRRGSERPARKRASARIPDTV